MRGVSIHVRRRLEGRSARDAETTIERDKKLTRRKCSRVQRVREMGLLAIKCAVWVVVLVVPHGAWRSGNRSLMVQCRSADDGSR